VGMFGESHLANRQIFRRKSITRQTAPNGDVVTTTVEEEV